MKILIVEDEMPAARRLEQLIKSIETDCDILATIDSVDNAVSWLRNFDPPDLIFMDIQLADGLSFDIFEEIDVPSPVIFTTAYDQYMQKAFEVYSVDYLLKPIDPEALAKALTRYHKLYADNSDHRNQDWAAFFESIKDARAYRKRFLVKKGNQLVKLNIEDVAYFYSEDGLTFLLQKTAQRHPIDMTLDELNDTLDPKLFFRINRKQIIHIASIQKIHKYFNQRLKLDLLPEFKGETVVSRERAKDFKSWLDS